MNKQSIIQYVDQKYQKAQPREFRIGDTVRVFVKIIEGTTARTQAFEGVVISFTGQGGTRNFTVRKISFGVGVERAFPLNSPSIEKVDILRSGHTRRAKLYYLRDRVGRAAKLDEKEASFVDAKKTSGVSKVVAPVAPVISSDPELVSVAKK